MSEAPHDLDENISVAKRLVDDSSNIVILTGAGISTDSGLPDFRGPNGIWTKNPEAEKASTISNYVNEPSVRKANWALRAEGRLWANVVPNAGHKALLPLQERSVLHTLVTQNVDELHQLSGIDAGLVVEIHGTTRKAGCLSCDYRTEMEAILERVRSGEQDPDCPNCGGIIKSATISFGQQLVAEDLLRAQLAADTADLLIAIGTTLTVNPIASIVPRAVRNGAALVIINAEPTPFDAVANAVIQSSISDVLPRIITA